MLTVAWLPRPTLGQTPWSWTTYQANEAHTGYVPASLEFSLFEPMWSVALSSRPLNPVAAGDGMVFATIASRHPGADQLFALRAMSGETLWTKGFGDPFSVSPPAYAHGYVYVQAGKAVSGPSPQHPLMHAYVGESGQFLFQQRFEAQWEKYYAPTVVDRVVYANGGYYGGIYAFDFHEPLVLWHTRLGQYDQWTPAVGAAAAFAYVGGRLSILDRESGQVTSWIDDPGFAWSTWSMNQAPVLAGEDDVLVIQAGRLVGFDLAAGQVRVDTGNEGFAGQPAVADGEVFALRAGLLSVRDQLTGDLLWEWSAGAPLVGTLFVTANAVLVRTDSAVYAVDRASHAAVWTSAVSGHLAWSEGILYVARADGVLTAIQAPAVIFRDGFETGDAGSWSIVVP